MSRRHLALTLGATLEVEDLGSANGTLIFRGNAASVNMDPSSAERLQSRKQRTLQPGDFVRLGAALIVVELRDEAAAAERPVRSSHPPPEFLPEVLVDTRVRRVYDTALLAAASDISVLITGETGVGKEILASTIHAHSSRQSRPLLRLNCAALPDALLESELFGHERGAFTGATQAKVGLLEANDQGTVFLDEIGEMSLSTQAKLLRVLEANEIMRVGATTARRINVRFIWATNRNLLEECRRGRFRQDLYYRIAGVEFSLPPLRERRAELEPLARLFLQRFCQRSGIPQPELSRDAVDAMQHYSWPGNVRELKNVMERSPFACVGGPITSAHVPNDTASPSSGFPPEHLELTRVVNQVPPRIPSSPGPRSRPGVASSTASDAERTRIAEALDECGGNQTRAAKLLGISRRTLVNRLAALDFRRPRKSS